MTTELQSDNASGLKGWKVSVAPFCLRTAANQCLCIWQISNCSPMLKFSLCSLIFCSYIDNCDCQAKIYAY